MAAGPGEPQRDATGVDADQLHDSAVRTDVLTGRAVDHLRHESAQARVDRLLRKPVFDSWRERVGAEEATAQFARRVHVLEGDLDAMPPVPPTWQITTRDSPSPSL